MKILCVSDYVEKSLYEGFKTDAFPEIDLILSCGDLPPEYLIFLANMFNVPLYFVKGNHDIRYTSKSPVGCTNIHKKIIQFHGYTFLGLEGSRWYNGGVHQYSDPAMKKMIKTLRAKIWWKGGVDVVITHAPPRYINDAEDPCHRGFKSFRWFIGKYSPGYFIHGHIHRNFEDDSQRITRLDQTRVINSYGHVIIELADNVTA